MAPWPEQGNELKSIDKVNEIRSSSFDESQHQLKTDHLDEKSKSGKVDDIQVRHELFKLHFNLVCHHNASFSFRENKVWSCQSFHFHRDIIMLGDYHLHKLINKHSILIFMHILHNRY